MHGGKPNDEELRQRLTPLQYKVTQHEGTEAPFRNEYWDHKDPGMAQLHPSARAGERDHAGGPLAADAPDRGPLS